MRLLLATLTLATAASASAATVDVRFVNPSDYTDAGTSVWDEGPNTHILARHLQRLGQQYLPADHQLKIDVLDVDLAGTTRDGGRQALRIVRGGADFPRMHLRYTLEAPGRAPVTGEEHLSDLTYTAGRAQYRASREALYYEKRMLEDWFRQRFAAATH